MSLPGFQTEVVEAFGAKIEVSAKGEGRPLVFLHPGQGLLGAGPALEKLAQVGRVIVPSHPGFGGSDLPATITTVDDLAYLYLDFLDVLDLRDVVLLGASFGGWIAAEIATKSVLRLGSIVLVDSLGIKIGARDERDIVDMHAVGDEELLDLLYADKTRRPHYASLSDAELLTVAKNNETFALFGWRPYMHNPKLRGRLRRISVPTLVVWGEEDRIVSPAYGRTFSTEIPQARFETVPGAGHFPFVEHPDEFVKAVTGFLSHARN